MNNNKRVPYGGPIGMRSSSSMDFHSHNNTVAAAAVLPRSSSAISLSSAAAAAALKRANSQDSTHSVMVPSKRAEQRVSIGLERRSSMSERVLRAQSVGPERRRLRHNNRETSQLTTLWTNSVTSTSSLPRTLRSSGGRRPSSSGYASSIRSYESDLNSISEDRTLDTSSILSSPKIVASKKVPPAITEELLSPPVKHAPPSRALSPSKSAMKDTSRPSSVVSSQSDTEEMTHSSKKKHVRISFSGATSTPPPAMPPFPTARKPQETNTASPRNEVDGVVQKMEVKTAAATTVKSPTDGATAVQQTVTSAHFVKDNEEKDSDSESSVYEDASDIIELDRDEFPNLLAVVDVITGETGQANGDAANKEIVDKVPSQAQSAAKSQPPAETLTRQLVGSTPSRKPVGSPMSIPFARMRTSRPSTDAESESREKSQNPTLQHPTPRTAKPLNGILKTPSPDLSRTATSDHRKSARGNHHSLPNSYLRGSSNSPPPLPSFDATTELNGARKDGSSSSSSFRRNTVGGSQATSGMKSSLRHILPFEDRSTLRRLESTQSKPASQSTMNHRLLHHSQSSQPATTKTSMQPSSFGVPFSRLRRSDSDSSFQREGDYESDSQAFGFKKFSSAAAPSRDQSSQAAKGPQDRIATLGSDSEGESPAYSRPSGLISRPLGVPTGTPTTGTSADTFKSRFADSDSEDEPAVAAPIIRKQFPSNHPFAYEPATATDTSADIPEEPNYPYDDATAGVAISDDVVPPVPPAVGSTVSAPTTPVKHRKLSQYQQHKLAKQQKKEEKERLKRVQETRNYGTNNMNTAIGPIANINSVPMPQPRKKKFGGLRKFLGLDH
ncbi:hypothetical protein V1520DRAFT_335212 [Lipomyces starkeyi]|uniref:Uncharacterized protein n=1 Tax=Lipomyces starkeyi NRRL Y-11557 TaxID=675824 RepID=A0A1E3QB02_LIPST|nr:hypothetical protein LIPSTDRAFT_115970 [Lipomyces starkeyi NRRL Y-11557]